MAAAVGVVVVGAGFVNLVLSHGQPVDGLTVPSGHYTMVSVAYWPSFRVVAPYWGNSFNILSTNFKSLAVVLSIVDFTKGKAESLC